MTIPPRVREGEELRASLHNQMRDAIVERTFHAGAGVLFASLGPFGTAISSPRKRARFNHSWSVTIDGSFATVSPGRINTMVATIGGRRIDNTEFSGRLLAIEPPRLLLSPTAYDAEGRSWIVIRCVVDLATGRLFGAEAGGVEIVQAKSLNPPSTVGVVEDGGSPDNGEGVGLCPIAMLKRQPNDRDFGSVIPIRFFDITHRFVRSTVGAGRHFFFCGA